MSSDSNRYVIAVKRAMRDQAPSDWVDRLQEIEGLRLVAEAQANRVLVEAHPNAIEAACTLLGDYCHVEPLIDHTPME